MMKRLLCAIFGHVFDARIICKTGAMFHLDCFRCGKWVVQGHSINVNGKVYRDDF